jgi:hypothetical protein
MKSGSVVSVKKQKKPLGKTKEDVPVVVHTESSELSKKLSSLQIGGGNVLAKKKYINF